MTMLTLLLALATQDWPQWRGPNRDGVSLETGLIKEWPGGSPKLLWQVDRVGVGSALRCCWRCEGRRCVMRAEVDVCPAPSTTA